MITGRILRTEESTDGRQNIKIIVEFSEDGKVIVPEWILWARWENFIGRTVEEMSEWIRVNVEYQIGNIIKERTKPVLNDEFIKAIELMKSTKIYQTDKVIVNIGDSLTVETPYKVTINADGTYTTDRAK